MLMVTGLYFAIKCDLDQSSCASSLQIQRGWKSMKNVLLSAFISFFIAFPAQASFINIEFSLKDMVYYDYVQDEVISFSDAFPSNVFLSFEIEDYYSLENNFDDNYTSVYFDDTSIDGTKIISPIISEFTSPMGLDPYSDFFIGKPNFRDQVSFSRSETQGAFGYFRESFLAYVSVAGYFDDGSQYGTRTSLSFDFFELGQQEKLSYPLIGSSLIDYFNFLKSNDVGLYFEDDYHIYDSYNEIYAEGIGSYGYAYISNISYDNNSVIAPEPSTAFLLGLGALGLAGIGRLRRK